jgi:ParB-like nuclease domain
MSETTQQIEKIGVSELNFDLQNPRLVEFAKGRALTPEEVLEILWEEMDVRELVHSMASSGFFPHEPLIVAKESGKNVVIEGNRRLAALNVLLHPHIAKANNWAIPEISEEILKSLEYVPVIFQDREHSWRYLGYKHVNGPAKWSSFAKARYIAQVHREFDVTLEDIASQIGDGHKTVQRLYRGLMVLEQAARTGSYDPENRMTPRIFFSHLYTALDYPGFATFLAIAPKESETISPVPEQKLTELGEVCAWLFGDRAKKQPPVIQSQNPDLKQLGEVLANREAVAALRAGEELSYAYEISRPSGAVLEEALLRAKRELMRASGYVATGYDKSEDLLRIAGSVATLADSVYEEMQRMKTGDSKRSRITDL